MEQKYNETDTREPDELLTATEVCQLLKIVSPHQLRDPVGAHKKQLRRLRQKSKFPEPVKVGKEHRWFRDEIMVWARQHRRTQLRASKKS